jgi:hypothetical protein
MTNRQPRRTAASKRPPTAHARTKHTPAAGISNRPPGEEEQQQEQLPPRGQAKKKASGGKA